MSPRLTSGPPARNVARMLVFVSGSSLATSGTYPCWPKKADRAMSVPGVAASNW